MSKIVKEVEEDIEVKPESRKKETYVVRWFRSHAVENPDDIKIISDLTSRSVAQQFQIYLNNSGNTEVYAVIFYATFLTILEFIREKQKKYNNYTIQIANSINIGYTNNDNEDNEKSGNFFPVLEYIGINRIFIDSNPDINDEDINDKERKKLSTEKSRKNCLGWEVLNIKHNAECVKDIQERTNQKLNRDFIIDIRVSEVIIPIFCIFMDNINTVVKLKFKEAEGTDLSEVHLNILGLFDVYYSYNEEENQEVYEYVPSITTKLMIKNDSKADNYQ
jgi:hypothetical protein